MPNHKGFFNEKISKAKLDLIGAWDKADLKPVAKATDIFRAVNLAANFFPQSLKTRKLLILSDMRESARYNLEKPVTIDIKILQQVEAKGLIPSLSGVKVWVLDRSFRDNLYQ